MALSADRNTPRQEGDVKHQGMSASVLVYAGAIVLREADGYLTKGQTATGMVGVGRAEERMTGGASDGAAKLKVRPGTFRYKNSTSGDLIAVADIGKVCFAVDDETVAKTDGSATRSIAGFIEDVDTLGVWVRFDEAAARAYLAGITLPAG